MEKQLKNELIKVGIVKRGSFVLKSGDKSDIYFDFRDLASEPALLKKVASKLSKVLPKETELLVGLPYAALPIATALSLESGIPFVYPRKEQKEYGTKKLLEGRYKKGQKAVIIDDVFTTGQSKKEAIALLEKEGLKIETIVVIVDRTGDTKNYLGKELISLWTEKDFNF